MRDSTRSAHGRTSVFAGRRGTSEGSQTGRKSRKSTKIGEISLRRCFANEPRDKNSICSLPGAPWCRCRSPRRAPGQSQELFLASQVALGDSPGAFGPRRRRPKTHPRRSRHAFGVLLGATGRPERVQGAILGRFWVPRGFSERRFWIDFRTGLDWTGPARPTMAHRDRARSL